MTQEEYEFVRSTRGALPVIIVFEILAFVYFTFFARYSRPALSVSLGILLLYSIPCTIWINREIARYEKEHFHSKDKENDSSDSSDSDTSPKS